MQQKQQILNLGKGVVVKMLIYKIFFTTGYYAAAVYCKTRSRLRPSGSGRTSHQRRLALLPE